MEYVSILFISNVYSSLQVTYPHQEFSPTLGCFSSTIPHNFLPYSSPPMSSHIGLSVPQWHSAASGLRDFILSVPSSWGLFPCSSAVSSRPNVTSADDSPVPIQYCSALPVYCSSITFFCSSCYFS